MLFFSVSRLRFSFALEFAFAFVFACVVGFAVVLVYAFVAFFVFMGICVLLSSLLHRNFCFAGTCFLFLRQSTQLNELSTKTLLSGGSVFWGRSRVRFVLTST